MVQLRPGITPKANGPLTSKEVRALVNRRGHVNEISAYLAQVKELRAFLKGVDYAGKPCPVKINDQAFDYVEFLLECDRIASEKEAQEAESRSRGG